MKTNLFQPKKIFRRGEYYYRKISSRHPFSYNLEEGWEMDSDLAIRILKFYFGKTSEIIESENEDGTFWVDGVFTGVHTAYDYWQYHMIFNPSGPWSELEDYIMVINFEGEKYIISQEEER